MYTRYLKLELEEKHSAFLWGARKTGKSTFLKAHFPESVRFDLLDTSTALKYSKEPWLFRTECLKIPPEKLKFPIIVDEVQKAPAILDEIHWLIENAGCHFILCGSSARQMKRVGVNMLGGRALRYYFLPLVYPEIKEDFDLKRIFNNGLIPAHYLLKNPSHFLSSYIYDYLAHEIKAEGLVRNLAGFSRFLETIAFSHGELINYSNIARDSHIDSKTVKEYYQILEDTLMGYFVEPYYKTVSRRTITSIPRFYMFDVGVANRLMNRTFQTIQGIEAGRALEHYIFLELLGYIRLNILDHKISHWRTNTGIEVDFIVHERAREPIPIEVKVSRNVHLTELKGLRTFMEEHNIKVSYLVCMEERARKIPCKEGDIILYPVKEFLQELWDGNIFK